MIDWISWLAIVGLAPPGGGEEGPAGLMGSPIFLIVMIVVLFYFILYKPERARKQQREKMLKELQRGDEVITSGGIHGRITSLTDATITLEVAPNVRIKVGRQFVSGTSTKEGSGAGERAAKEKGKDKDKSGKKEK